MKSKSLLIILFVVAAVVLLLYSQRQSQSPEEYVGEIEVARKEKDFFMKESESSPLKSSKEKFTGLNYFPPDPKYKINAGLSPVEEKKMRVLGTSDGAEKKYLENAYAEFTLDGITNKLLILEITENGPYRGTLFLAFADKTSTHETYGAGRYLEVKKIPGASTILLDFNKAYNPDCAYSDGYSCPFPPRENILNVAINAGEKSYHP